jgi:hypothetical protein
MFDFTQYKELLKLYMHKHNVSYKVAIDDMDLETAEKLFYKLMIYEYMELYGVSYTKAMQLLAVENVSGFNNISMY